MYLTKNSSNPYTGLVYIIVLNWNGWEDTIECLESVFRNKYPNYRVVLCDNDSSNNSLEYIKSWAEGRLDFFTSKTNPLRYLTFPPIPKPVRYLQYNRATAESDSAHDGKNAPLVLIQTGANLGYAGGNNVGIRYALIRKPDYIWLLNNDTVIHPDALNALVQKDQCVSAGICGSSIYWYDNPKSLQAYGGKRINWILGHTSPLCYPRSRSPDYVAGTSLFVRSEVLNTVGLLDERYFFYWEDADFSIRARKSGWRSCVAGKSIVYHKGSVSVKNRAETGRSAVSDILVIKSRVFFFCKNRKHLFWPITVFLSAAEMIFSKVLQRQWDRVPTILKTIKAGYLTGSRRS